MNKFGEDYTKFLENELNRMIEKVATYERALAAYGDPKGVHILRAVDKGWDNETV